MSENREVTLADFQACSGIDDVGEAIMHLESSDWDLVNALNKVMHHDTQQLPSEMNPDIEMLEVVQGVPVITFSSSTEEAQTSQNKNRTKPDSPETVKPSTSSMKNSKSPKMLIINVNYLDKKHKIEISELSTLSDLKAKIFKKTNVAPCQQQLHGWKKKEPPSPGTILGTLKLPQETSLFMTPNAETGDSSSEQIPLSDRLTRTYTLNIYDEIGKKNYSLKFPGLHTILKVKSDVYSLIDVPVRYQQWTGWPASATDDKILAESGIEYPEHDLTVSKTPVNEKEKSKELVDLVDSDSTDLDEIEEFEDAPGSFLIEDDLFIDNIGPTKIQSLMPENVEDETMGTLHFAEQFAKRYGPAHPEFFTGTFDEALKESCLKPPKDRKILAVYLHHDNSVLANVFCTQLLGCETVLQLLSANFVIWGWDFTHNVNKMKFLNSVTQSLGMIGSEAVQNINFDTLPVLIILMRSRSTTEIFTIVHGNVGVNELLTNLIHAVDVFQEQRRADIGAEEERQARERVKQEQDRAYQESLAVDRAKEEAKIMQIKLAKQQKEQAENERLAEIARKESIRLSVESSLPSEPADSPSVFKIRVRLPGGKFLERRFLPDTKLQILLNFIVVEGFPTDEYKVLSSWPRRDLSSMDTQLTFTELKFCPQETLILEER